MLKVLAIIVLVFSSVAMADVEFKVVWPKTECTISKGEVTRTMSFGKDKDVGFTQKSQISMVGVEAAAKKAAPFASNIPSDDDEGSFTMILDGKTYELQLNESTEALQLIQLLVQACQLR